MAKCQEIKKGLQDILLRKFIFAENRKGNDKRRKTTEERGSVKQKKYVPERKKGNT
jgi:hypothetical protein